MANASSSTAPKARGPAAPAPATPAAAAWPWNPPPWLVKAAPAVLILVAWYYVFSPVFHAGWLNSWDDDFELTSNLTMLDPGGWWHVWFAPQGNDYFPLKTLLEWFLWQLRPDDAAIFHQLSAGLHLLSAFLFWRVLSRLGLRFGWVGGLLMVVHPVMVESVAWVSELKNTVSLPLLLGAALCYLRFEESRQWRLYAGALIFFLAAMLAKSSVVMFPVVLLLYAWWKRGTTTRADWLAATPFFAVSLVLGLVTVGFQSARAVGGTVIPLDGLAARLAGAGQDVAFYLGKALWPADVEPIYPRWSLNPPSLLQFLPWVFILGALGWLWTKRAGWGRPVLFGLGFFLLNLLPVMGFVNMSFMRIGWVSDHLAYVPMLGLFGLVAAGLGLAARRLAAPARPVVAAVAGLVAVLLAAGSRNYAAAFTNDNTFWPYAVQANPASWAAHNNYGYAIFQQGRVDEAISEYVTALRIDPNYPEAHVNLGNALWQSGHYNEAVAEFKTAQKLAPDLAPAYSDLGLAYLNAGRLDDAKHQFDQALKLSGDSLLAHLNLGNYYMKAQQPDQAVTEYLTAVRLQPEFPDTHFNLAQAFLALKNFPAALKESQEALRLRPSDAGLQLGLSLIYNKAGNAALAAGLTQDAVAYYQQALTVEPGLVDAHYNLGQAWLSSQKFADALKEFQIVVQARPTDPGAFYGLGVAKAATGDLPGATAALQAALKLRPDFTPAQQALGKIQAAQSGKGLSSSGGISGPFLPF